MRTDTQGVHMSTPESFDRIGIFGTPVQQPEPPCAQREAERTIRELRSEVDRLNRVVAALKNDALASGARYEELWDLIQTLAHTEPPPAQLCQFRVERLASVTMDLVGALLEIEEIEDCMNLHTSKDS
jgi:hypothetical protein